MAALYMGSDCHQPNGRGLYTHSKDFFVIAGGMTIDPDREWIDPRTQERCAA